MQMILSVHERSFVAKWCRTSLFLRWDAIEIWNSRISRVGTWYGMMENRLCQSTARHGFIVQAKIGKTTDGLRGKVHGFVWKLGTPHSYSLLFPFIYFPISMITLKSLPFRTPLHQHISQHAASPRQQSNMPPAGRASEAFWMAIPRSHGTPGILGYPFFKQKEKQEVQCNTCKMSGKMPNTAASYCTKLMPHFWVGRHGEVVLNPS